MSADSTPTFSGSLAGVSGSGAGPAFAEDREITYLGLVNGLIRQRHWILGFVAASVIGAAVYLAIRPASYEAVSEFAPQSVRAGSNRLAGLASQLGFASQGASTESVPFFMQLATSSQLLADAVARTYARTENGPRVTLVDVYGSQKESPGDPVRHAVGQLRANTAVTRDVETGTVRVRVTAPTPALALGVNRELLALLNEYNVNLRHRAAAAEREFVEARLADANAELEQAESALKTFLQSNRLYRDSPDLLFEANRLERKTMLREQVVRSLTELLDQVRMDEFRNTPSILVVDPVRWARDARLPPLFVVIAALLLGLVLGVSVAGLIEIAGRQQVVAPDAYREFRRLNRDVRAEVGSLTRAFRKGSETGHDK